MTRPAGTPESRATKASPWDSPAVEKRSMGMIVKECLNLPSNGVDLGATGVHLMAGM